MATATTQSNATKAKQEAKKTATQARAATGQAKATAQQAERTVMSLLTDSAYATLGAGDRAAAFLRGLNDIRFDVPQRLIDLRDQAPKLARDLRKQTVSTVEELRGQARAEFDALAERGRKRVESVRRSRKVSEASDQVRTARSQVKAAATSVSRAVETNVEAASKVVGQTGRKPAPRTQTQQTGDQRPYEERTLEELRERAAELGIEGRSQMTKDELVRALRNVS
jgi:hypothetical protein